MLALLSVVSLVFSLAQFLRSSCAEPPATKSAVVDAVRQELQRCDEEAAAKACSAKCGKQRDATRLTAER